MSFVFISYSRKDMLWKERLVDQLTVLEKHGYLETWDDSKIKIGAEWKEEIVNALNKTTLAIILVSKNFLASDFIMKDEISRLLEKKKKEKIRIVPLFIEPCMWTAIDWLKSLQGIPNDGRYLSELSDHEVEYELTTFSQQIIEYFNENKNDRFPRASGFIKQQNLKSNEIRQDILSGFDKIASYARLTFGPKGHQIIFNSINEGAVFSSDFKTIISKIELEGNATDIPVKILRTYLDKLIEGGTKTTTILAHSIFREGIFWIQNENISYISIKRGIEKIKNDVFDELNSLRRDANDFDTLEKVILTQVQENKEISKLIIEAFKKNGIEKTILIETSEGLSSEISIKPGIHFDKGFISPHFVTDVENKIAEYEDPYILIIDKRISSMQELVPVLEKTLQTGRPLMIIAEDIDSQALGILVVNRLRAGLKVVFVKAPFLGTRRSAFLVEVANLTGGIVINTDLGYKLENVEIGQLGVAKKIHVSKSESIIIVENVDIELLKESNEIGIIKVGGISEEDIRYKKELIYNSIEGAKKAYLNGVLPGGGITFLRLSDFLSKSKYENIESICSQILIKAFEEPIKEILRNADLDFEQISKKLSNQDSWMGYNLLIEEYEDMYESGIVEPIKNIQTSIENSILIGVQLLSGHVVFAKEQKQEEENKDANVKKD